MSDQLMELIATAAIKDEDIKAALLKYMQALTDKEKPVSDWTVVWFDTTTEPRVYSDLPDIDPYTGMTIKQKHAYVFTEVKYSHNHGVAKLTAYLSHEPYNAHKIRYMLNTFSFDGNPFYTAAQDVSSLRDAVLFGQAVWPLVLEKFNAATEPGVRMLDEVMVDA